MRNNEGLVNVGHARFFCWEQLEDTRWSPMWYWCICNFFLFSYHKISPTTNEVMKEMKIIRTSTCRAQQASFMLGCKKKRKEKTKHNHDIFGIFGSHVRNTCCDLTHLILSCGTNQCSSFQHIECRARLSGYDIFKNKV